MDHPGFFENSGPFSVEEIARIIGAEFVQKKEATSSLIDVKPLDQAGAGHLSFFENKKYLSQFETTNASTCIISPQFKDHQTSTGNLLIVTDAYRAYAVALHHFYPQASKPSSYGDHTSADRPLIHPEAQIEEGAIIEPGAIIGKEARIGRGTKILSGAVIGYRCYIGRDCLVAANASISCSIIGDNVILHQGVGIGQDGFGFAMGAQGHLKVPQIGRVIIQDDVEVGANTTIDRGALSDTIIGEGTKIDNLVQIGHNVVIGRNCIIVSQVGISGSTELGDFVIFGGQGGCVGHIKIGSGVKIAANGKISKDIEPGLVVGGAPAMPILQWKREVIALRRLAAKKKKR
ncbi:MAG: UDP-3-O-(3-hydroxymyristoyl)glucosamine N-acyltransferase [Hyphomicrobiaceae bacterium]|nr:UDP-3-O-(3-hydroxymyristoyl)glucosamine N-acyltransferase [Hyphomicrobiaceae bacterium]